MLAKHSWRHNATRAVCQLKLLTVPSLFVFDARMRRSGEYSKTGKCLFRKSLALKRRLLPPVHMFFLPGTVLKFMHHPNNCISALVQSVNHEKYLIPAVRGLKKRARINTKSVGLGSFIPIKRALNSASVCNIMPNPMRPPQLLRAPGTFARLLRKGKVHTLLLKNKRILSVEPSAWVQLGANAAAGHRHCVAGSAGSKRRQGYRPLVRAVAKNPHCHMSLRWRVKKHHI